MELKKEYVPAKRRKTGESSNINSRRWNIMECRYVGRGVGVTNSKSSIIISSPMLIFQVEYV